MKILALHGLGSSASMLREQIAPFIRDLGPSYQFTFVDGAIPCGRGPGVPQWASGPFYSYATGFSPPEVRDALTRLDDFVKEKGPFDGVFGFSLGSALAMAYMLDRQSRQSACPFSFAVLFSPIFIASPDGSYCEEVVRRMLDDDHEPFRSAFPDGDFAPLLDIGGDAPAIAKKTFAMYLQTVLSMHSMVGMVLPNTQLDFFGKGKTDAIPRLLHPLLSEDRVKIPTVYVTGERDMPAIAEQSRVAKGLCMASLTHSHTHAGGHDIPFKRSDVKAIVSSIRMAAEEAFE
ncbi:serine hydrolase FSH [Xylariaceae sp. AK1471]|nr:serine hydrolase FSH [Xylariaceae sp. AK1471]